MDAVIRHPRALHSDNVMAYDNAVSALGKICQFHRDGIDAAQVLHPLYFFTVWINFVKYTDFLAQLVFSSSAISRSIILFTCHFSFSFFLYFLFGFLGLSVIFLVWLEFCQGI